MEIRDFLSQFSSAIDTNNNREDCGTFRNEVDGNEIYGSVSISSGPFLISCESMAEKQHKALGHIVPRIMRERIQNSNNNGGHNSGIRAFNDADIAEYNEWAASDTKCPVIKIIRKASDFLVFTLRHPVHWKRIYASLDDRNHAQLFDCIFDGPKGIRKDKEHTMRSVGIRVSTGSASKLENMSFVAYAYWDEQGDHILKHPNVAYESGKICMGTLAGSTILNKLHISDIITLMEGVNMTSAYSENRKFYNNNGDEFHFSPEGSIYGRKDMFKPHSYLG
jgi:hypothetical protein